MHTLQQILARMELHDLTRIRSHPENGERLLLKAPYHAALLPLRRSVRFLRWLQVRRGLSVTGPQGGPCFQTGRRRFPGSDFRGVGC